MPASDASGLAGWFVRRAGVARCTTIAAAAGLSLAGIWPGRHLVAMAGLALALIGMAAGHTLSRVRHPGRTGLGLVVISVVLVGLFAGLLLGTLRISSLLDHRLLPHIGETVQADIVVTGPVRAESGWQSAPAVVTEMSPAAGDGRSWDATCAGGKVLLEIPPVDPAEHQALTVTQGAVLSITGRLLSPKGPSDSGFDQARQLLHQGIEVVVRADADAVRYRGQRGGISGWFDRLREAAKTHISLGPNARVNEVLQGVVMGDTAGIDEAWMEAFRRSGTAHMLSVSGLHVGSLAAIMIALAGLAHLSRRVGYLLAAAAALLMIPFVGQSPPIVRAASMIVVVLAGRLVGRRRDQWQGLAFAAMVVLMINPFAAFDVGFQLSFCAFAGMLGLVHPIERLLHRLPDSIRANLAVSFAATLGTAPVSLLVFGRTSLVAPVANLLVVPTLAAVTGLGMASFLLGYVWHGFSVALDALASVPVSWTVLVSTLCARVPVLGVGSIGRVLCAAAVVMAALPAALALTGRTPRFPFGLSPPLFDRSLAWMRSRRPRSRRRATGLALATLATAVAIGMGTYPAATAGLRSAELLAGGRQWPTKVEVRVLDVGQGTAVLVRTPEHHAALFDGGPAGCGLAGQLRALGVRRLDLVVISHPHADHFAGLLEALGTIDVATFADHVFVVDPASGLPLSTGADGAAGTNAEAGSATEAGIEQSSSWWSARTGPEDDGEGEAGQYLRLRRSLASDDCRLLLASPGSSLSLDGVRVSFFGPDKPLAIAGAGDPWRGRGPPSGDELNASSLVAVLSVGASRILLPGDAEAEALSTYGLAPVQVTVVPHHGSREAVSRPLLSNLQSKLAVISVGKNNPFGHPDESTLEILAADGETVVRTDQSGWVSLRVDGKEVEIFTERNQAR